MSAPYFIDRFARRAFVRNATGIAVNLRLDGSIEEARRLEDRVNTAIRTAPADEIDRLEEIAGDAEECAMNNAAARANRMHAEMDAEEKQGAPVARFVASLEDMPSE